MLLGQLILHDEGDMFFWVVSLETEVIFVYKIAELHYPWHVKISPQPVVTDARGKLFSQIQGMFVSVCTQFIIRGSSVDIIPLLKSQKRYACLIISCIRGLLCITAYLAEKSFMKRFHFHPDTSISYS